MKLSLTVLLVTLAFGCSEALPQVCPALVTDMVKIFLETANNFHTSIQKYNAPPEAVFAAMQFKGCIDNLTPEGRVKYQKFWSNVVAKCNS
ncbi:secretoglobin family 1D member 2-like [Saccopteryx bilineata]|uniref:secretoglobin family 1D member 2-like n=1 Tax=Saccopteryx bilineata TaxID=59482 RepID=UPI00338E7F7A